MVVTWHPQTGSREQCVLVLSSLPSAIAPPISFYKLSGRPGVLKSRTKTIDPMTRLLQTLLFVFLLVHALWTALLPLDPRLG